MIDLGSWAETLGLRRKRTFVERVQDAAEDMIDTVLPTLTMPARAISKPSKSKMASRFVDRVEDVADAWDGVTDTITPVIKRSRKMAKHAFKDSRHMIRDTRKSASRGLANASDMASWGISSASDVASKGLSTASSVASDAASKAGSTAAATREAAAEAASGVGGALGTVFSSVWWLFTFTLKAALLAGVAYAGWQWLQTRRDTTWSGLSDSSDGSYSSGTYGTMSGVASPAAAGVR
jgi:hypothetical protein